MTHPARHRDQGRETPTRSGPENGVGSVIRTAGTYTLAGSPSLLSDNGGTVSAGTMIKTGVGTALLHNTFGTAVSTDFLDVREGTLDIQGGLIVENGGTIRIAEHTNLNLSTDYTNLENNRIEGAGTLSLAGGSATLINRGVIAPGFATTFGTLTVIGDLAQDPFGSIAIAQNYGRQFSQLRISGSIQMRGGLRVTGFANRGASDPFQALTYGSMTGAFSSISLPTGILSSITSRNVTIKPNNNRSAPNDAEIAWLDFQSMVNPKSMVQAVAALGETLVDPIIFNTVHGSLFEVVP